MILDGALFEAPAVSRLVTIDRAQTICSRNPATGEDVGTTTEIGADQVETIIHAAREAFIKWREHPASKRSEKLRAYFNLIRANRDGLAQLVTFEQGKPLREAYGEVDYAASYVEWYAEEAKRAYGETIPSLNAETRLFVAQAPVGVCAAITPWNFPIAMITRKLAPALAAGCSMIIKPAPQTPLCAVALGNMWRQVCDIDGLVQIAVGDAPVIGSALLSSEHVRKFSFTGSTKVGRYLYKAAADTVKRVSLELGGNAPFLVLNDANIEAAVQGALAAKYRNAGQTCVCVNRFIVDDQVYDSFRDGLVEASKELTIGNGIDDPDIGPLIDADAMQKVEELVEDAHLKGGNLVLQPERSGLLMTPAVIEATPDMRVSREEVFGPVSTLLRANDTDHAIAMANSLDVGLAGYVYGSDLNNTWRTAERLEVGMVGVNTGLISNAAAPFGGVKQSGIGREGGRQGMREYLEEKYLCVGGF